MNSVFLKEMQNKTITRIIPSNDYYTKCLLFEFLDGSSYTIKYINQDLFVESVKDLKLDSSEPNWRLLYIFLIFVFSIMLNFYNAYNYMFYST